MALAHHAGRDAVASGAVLGDRRPYGPIVVATLVMLAAIALVALPGGRTRAATGGSWATYGHDNGRAAFDPDQPAFDTVTTAWPPIAVDGQVYAQPLIVGSQVLVATENNSIYSFDLSSGAQNWAQTQLAPPVPSGLPCGFTPVGITGTPVVDTSTGLLYAVLLVSTPSIHHELWALDINHGGARRFNVTIDPPGGNPAFDPTTQGQRGALALNAAQGLVYIGWGGRPGDCGTYRGWVVAARATDGTIMGTFQTNPDGTAGAGGGIWAPAGPSIDPAGNVYVATGNSTATSGGGDDSESVQQLGPLLDRRGQFRAPEWQSMNATDSDLGSLSPMGLSGGLVFAAGKNSNGYLVQSSPLVDDLGSFDTSAGQWLR